MDKVIKQTYLIKAPVGEVWKALVDPKYIEKWGGGPAKMDDKVGTKFELWGGDIWGTNTQVENPPTGGKKLVQDWYGGNWPKPSQVTFLLSERGGQTQVDLIHENLPEDEVENFGSGWRDFYLGSIKEYLESK